MLVIPSSRFLQECRQKWCILALSVLLCAGVGVSLSKLAGEPYLLLMRMAVSRPVSIVGTVVCLAPYLVCVLFHFKPWLVCIISSFRIALFTVAIWAIYKAFGSAGWLVGLLMHFPDICLIPGMLCLCSIPMPKHRLIFICIFSLVLGMIYYGWISPFLANLLDTYETMGRYAIHVGLDRRL